MRDHRQLLRAFAFGTKDRLATQYQKAIFDNRYCYVDDAGICQVVCLAVRRELLRWFRLYPDPDVKSLCNASAISAALSARSPSTREFLIQQIVLASLEIDWRSIGPHVGVAIQSADPPLAMRHESDAHEEDAACRFAVQWFNEQKRRTQCVLLVPQPWDDPHITAVLVVRLSSKRYTLVFVHCTLHSIPARDQFRQGFFTAAAARWVDALRLAENRAARSIGHEPKAIDVELRWLWVIRPQDVKGLTKHPPAVDALAHIESSVPFSLFHDALANA